MLIWVVGAARLVCIGFVDDAAMDLLRCIMWEYVGFDCFDVGFRGVLVVLDDFGCCFLGLEVVNLVLVVWFVAIAALICIESRGVYRRVDHLCIDLVWVCYVDVWIDGDWVVVIMMEVVIVVVLV